MGKFCVHKKARDDGYHEVHLLDCPYAPSPKNFIKLGEHLNCTSALRAAKRLYIRSDGCEMCCPGCATR